MNKVIKRCLLGACLIAAGVGTAHAQVDVSAATGALTDAQTGVASISALMLGVAAAGIAVKWIVAFLV